MNSPHGERILIVDDNEQIRLALLAFLESVGYDVDLAPDGSSALRAVRGNEYDLLIVDHNMPGLEGPEVVKRIRNFGNGNRRMPILGMSVDDSPNVRDRCINAGMNGFFVKDAGLDNLLEEMDRLLHAA